MSGSRPDVANAANLGRFNIWGVARSYSSARASPLLDASVGDVIPVRAHVLDCAGMLLNDIGRRVSAGGPEVS